MPDPLVWRDSLRHKLHDRLRLRRLSQYDDALRHLARIIVRIRNHCGISHGWMRQQQGLELCGWHLKSLVLDQLLRSIDDEEVSILIEVSDVTRVKPAFDVDCLRGRFRVVQVACHDLRSAHAYFASFSRPKLLTVFEIDDLAFGIRRRNTD